LRYLEKAAEDSDLQMRLAAYRAVAARDPKRATPVLRKLMRAENFLERDNREQVAIAVALGETRTSEAIEFFGSVFEAKASLFNRSKHNELKKMAIMGLIAIFLS